MRRKVAEDVALVLHISPLLKKGVVSLVSEDILCRNCLGKALGYGRGRGRSFTRALSHLANGFLEGLSAEAELRGRYLGLNVTCAKPYSEHGCMTFIERTEMPRVLQDRPRIMQRLSKGTPVVLSKTMTRALGIHRDLAWRVVHSVGYHAIINKYLSTSFLTDKELELAFLNRPSGDMRLERRNAIAMKHLTAFVPFVIDVPLGKLSALRQREAESFVRFRCAFNTVLSEFTKQDSRFSAKAARQLYGDVLAPELARLDDKVKRAKRDLISSATRPLVGMVGAISFGLLSGLIPAQVAQVAQAAGIASFGPAFLQKLMALGDATRAIEQDDFYFLWKVRKLAKR